jgi:hypothetical protein
MTMIKTHDVGDGDEEETKKGKGKNISGQLEIALR